MTDTRQDKVRKLFESRVKAETELQRLQEKVQDAVENNDRRVCVERLVTSCNGATSQRQRDLLIAKQRNEVIERQKEAALRIAKQQQKLELERLQEEQELLRLRTDRLKKEEALRVEQLEEENGKKLAEATNTELELTEDLSDSQSEFLDTVSQLAASTNADDTLRVSGWVNNSTVATARDPTNTVILEMNAVIIANTAQTSVNRGAPTTTPKPSFPVVTPVAPTAPMTNNIPLATGQGSKIYLPSTGPVQVPQSTTTPQGTNAPSVTATASAPLATATSFPISTVTVPASHILPNLSAWTFPTGPSNPPANATPESTNHNVFPTVLPATSVARQHRLLFKSQREEQYTILTRRLWQLFPQRAAHQYRSSMYRFLLLPVLLSKISRKCYRSRRWTTSLNGNWPITVEIHFNGTSGLASSRVPSIQHQLPMT